MTHATAHASFPTALAGLFTLGAVFLAPSAHAQEACGETTCEAGYVCQEFAAPCPLIDCGDAPDCAPCAAEPYHACTPAPCTDDTQCGDYMVCATHQQSVCPDVACADDECKRELDCSTVEHQECTPPWMLPCEADVDCSEGFTCEQQQSCSCGGSEPSSGATPEDRVSGAPAAGEAMDLPLLEANCECVPSELTHCQQQQIVCDGDADCPEHWSCQDNPNGVCWRDAESGESECEPADPARLCMPPGQHWGMAGDTVLTTGEADPAADEAVPATGGRSNDLDGNPFDPAGGCSLTTGAPASGSGVGLMLLGLAGVLFGRRRRV